ncbi:glycosyltransferase family 2 protein [Chthonobacter albigriseus]|uniref:glycosyltransferase family 2 protein n=1 Tax=Chthonobacter albigriseus TaxID=1683161 RepID=UPI0015EF06F5|nr:glycosyltransferase family 2 protein [Chthonobacter albigriseus]
MSEYKASIAVLITCFNRRETTLACLEALHRSVPDDVHAKVFLVDDASTDGTAAAVARRFPHTTIIHGDGNRFWNGGMRLAWQHAIPSQPDFYLWLNDDLAMAPHTISTLLKGYAAKAAEVGRKVIMVGRTTDPVTGKTTYGGYARAPGVSRLRYRLLEDGESECYTMHGNCVLIPAQAVKDVGIHDEAYTHAFGDVDYGLRAGKAGYRIFQCEEPVGQQEHNEAYVHKTSVLTLANWRFILFSPKGVPLKEWLHFCREHGGGLWPVNFLTRYAKMIRMGLSSGRALTPTTK